MIYVGIDPGQAGAVAIINVRSLNPVKVYDMPSLVGIGVYDLLGSYKKESHIIVIEKSNPMTGGSGGYGKGIATYMVNYGKIIGALEIMQMTFYEVHPATWKKVFKLNKIKGIKETEKERKQKSVIVAHKLFPKIEFQTPRGRMLDGRADALLLAEYGRLIYAR
jgi:hypothetical protein